MHLHTEGDGPAGLLAAAEGLHLVLGLALAGSATARMRRSRRRHSTSPPEPEPGRQRGRRAAVEPELIRERKRILDHIERDRARLHEAVDDLEGAVHERFTVGARVSDHAYLRLLGAAFPGAALGARRRR